MKKIPTLSFSHPANFANPSSKTTFASPLTEFEPWNIHHYPPKNEHGIYLYGIRCKVENELKFIPIVVGEGNLSQRLFNDHYLGKFDCAFKNLTRSEPIGIKESKEIWDFSKKRYDIKELNRIYNDLRCYDKLSKLKAYHSSRLTSLLYFQDIDFFNHKHGFPLSLGPNIRSDQAVFLLAERIWLAQKSFVKKINTKLKGEIQTNWINLILTLNNFVENFYYVYAVDHEYLNKVSDKNLDKAQIANRLSAEHRTKKALEVLGIFTTAADKPSKSSDYFPTIDFSGIQNELVNLGGHSYNDNTGKYIKSLIIPNTK